MKSLFRSCVAPFLLIVISVSLSAQSKVAAIKLVDVNVERGDKLENFVNKLRNAHVNIDVDSSVTEVVLPLAKFRDVSPATALHWLTSISAARDKQLTVES